MPGILLGLHKCFNISEFKHSKTFYLCSRNFQGKPLAYELTDEYLKWGMLESSCKNSRISFAFSEQPTQFTIQKKGSGF
jgi:hypothetical protein